jgi:hypothetical protein
MEKIPHSKSSVDNYDIPKAFGGILRQSDGLMNLEEESY